MYQTVWEVLDWFYPPACVGCGLSGFHCCEDCQGTIQFLEHPSCWLCGRSVSEGNHLCDDCSPSDVAFDGLCSLAFYGGIIRTCVHALKYENHQALGGFFTSLLVECLSKYSWDLDQLIPVPLSPDRMKIRGYNQSALLGHPVALVLGIQYLPFALRRIRNTRSQVELSADERRDNVKGAFRAVPHLVNNKTVLLVDDVTTTGSTLNACAEALKAAGAKSIFCLTLARTLHPDHRSCAGSKRMKE
jgi:ComF family protein